MNRCTYCGALLKPVKGNKVQWYTAEEGEPVYRLDFVCPNWRWWKFYTHDRIKGFLHPDGHWQRMYCGD